VSTAAILVRLADAPALVVAFWRLAFAVAILAPAGLVLARRDLLGLDRRTLAGLALVGVVLAVHFAAWIQSLYLTSVASSVFLVTLHPVVVGLASTRLYGEGLPASGWVGVLVALAGGGLIALTDAGAPGTDPILGDALALVGALAAAAYFLAGRGYRRRLGLLAYVVPVYASCAATLLVLALAFPPPASGPLFGWGLGDWMVFAALAIVPMILGHTVINWALKFVTAPVVATSILGEPVGSTLLAFFVLNETPTAGVLAGGALVLLGIWLVTRPRGAAASATAATETP